LGLLPDFAKGIDKAHKFPASSLDFWLGGEFWRNVAVPRSKHSSMIFPDTECKLSVGVESLCWCSHKNCSFCTFGIPYRLDGNFADAAKMNPLFLLAGAKILPPSLACNTQERVALRYYVLHFETTRHIKLNMMLFRQSLREAQLNE